MIPKYILHPVLEAVAGPSPAEAQPSDSQRLALLLSGVALLAHLEDAGWHLPRGFADARVEGGVLRGLKAAAGHSDIPAGKALRGLLEELFGDLIVGRGPARRAARRLRELWSQRLLPVSAERALEQIFATAPFLWQGPFAAARGCLVAVWTTENGEQWRAVGSMGFRRRLRAASGDVETVRRLLAEEPATVAEWWAGSPAGEEPGKGGRVTQARRRVEQGRFEEALDLLSKARGREARVLRAVCQGQLGKLAAAVRTLNALESELVEMDGKLVLEATDTALRVFSNFARGKSAAGRRRWLDGALAVGRREGGASALRAELLAATAAWDRGETDAMEGHLDASKEAASTTARQPRLAWRWHQAVALAAMNRADGEAVVENLSTALSRYRRHCRPFEAAALWNDLGIGRAQQGDLVGAERAFRHTHRLLSRCQGPRSTTLALYNLAEIRLRRGRLEGVRETLERTTVENRRSANLRGSIQDAELWARYEMVLGRYRAALSHLREAQGRLEEAKSAWRNPQLSILAARALGSLGWSAEAAAELEGLEPSERRSAVADLEVEERPALWALAGYRGEALETAAGTLLAPLWTALLTGKEAPVTAWQPLDDLEPYRAARLVLDADRLLPGSVPPRRRRIAADTLRNLGAPLLAQELESRDAGPWKAVEEYLRQVQRARERRGNGDGVGKAEAASTLFQAAGYSEAVLLWQPPPERGEAPRQIFGRPAGGSAEQHLETRVPGEGSWQLHLGQEPDSVASALFFLAVRDLRPPRSRQSGRPRRGAASRGGMVGESPELGTVLERLQRLAMGEMPLLILGESGTGKELAARAAHRWSPRREGSFVAINCAALSETLITSDLFGHVRGAFTGADRERAGVFETARGGVVFLDEIGDLPAAAQGMLLRVLQEGEVRRLGESLPRAIDARLVTATHRDLGELVQRGEFRQDLYYRLKVAAVRLPPLRKRGDDVVRLAEHFLADHGASPPPRLSATARRRLISHPWPGNVRELKNVLSVAATLADEGTIEPLHLELPSASEALSVPYHEQVDALRRRLVTEALTACGGNRSEAARRLGLTRQAMSYLVRQLGIEG